MSRIFNEHSGGNVRFRTGKPKRPRKGASAPKPAIDRRVARTRNLLQQALLALIARKPYETITVADICAAANVGRSTFYAHYRSRDDLKRSGLDHLRRQLAEHQRQALAHSGGERGLSFSLPLLAHAREHIGLYKALAGSKGGAIALGTIRQIVTELVRKDLAAMTAEKLAADVPRELAVQFVVGAFLAMLTWWLDGGARLASEAIDGLFRRMIAKGIPQSP